MRPIRTVIITLLVGSLTSFARAWVPEQDAPRTIAGSIKQEQSKPPRETPQPKPPAAPEKNPPKIEKEPQKKQQPKQEQKKQNPPSEHRPAPKQSQPMRPTGRSARIPDNQFKAHFGRPHTFPVKRVMTTTTVIPNQTRFVYSGYTFIILDPWPTDWLLADDCFIDYVDDEYFLFDVFHPGVRIALFVVE